ncbi:putative calcium/sodium:proton antiporter [uncultured Ruminococcus sp.]|nr:putative calcium/sodium:proton antiporter [uncultured Clostridium sp.]SCI50056.1 putative calcium/sodium:proton antiporter [uncultured Ruminococcus sp.]
MIFIIYFVLAVLVVLCSVKCADYVDLLDKKTNISGAFIGGIILAAVTSLPELFTSISSLYVVDNPELIIGNVLGSNVFNLAVLGALVAFTARNFIKSKVAPSHMATLVCSLIAYLGCAFATLTGWGTIPVININIVSLLIIVVYVISFRFLSSDDTANDEEADSPLTVRQIVVRFILMALGLVVASICITWATDQIASKLNLNASLAGALFLGVATSLPELTSSVALVRKRNYNAMFGNIIGSNMFNFTILSIADILCWKQSIYIPSYQTTLMLIFGVLSSVIAGAILLKRRAKKEEGNAAKIFHIICSLGIVLSYLLFLVLSA